MKNDKKPKLTNKEMFEYYSNDFYAYCEDHLKILTKTGELVPLKANQPQKILADLVIKHLKEEKIHPGRWVVLKGRQMGLSTIIQALLFWKTIFSWGYRSFVMAHDADSSINLFGMTNRFYEHRGYPMNVTTKRANKKELVFDPTDSSYLVKTVGAPAGTRSFTMNGSHMSEAGFWEINCSDPEGTFNGIMQSMPDNPQSLAFVESTAFGYNFFKKLCDLAEFNRDSPWKFVFIPWFLLDEYSKPAPSDFAPTDIEKKLIKLYDLDYNQLYWRRLTIGSNPNGEETFKQEYPCCAEEAFLMSGRGVFDTNILAECKQNVDRIITPFHDMDHKGELKPVSYKTEYRMYEPAIKGENYYIGIDSALGKGHDYSVISISDSNGRDVFMYSSNKVEPHILADIANTLGMYYNYAIIAAENNNMGIAVINRLTDNGYNNLFYNIIFDKEGYYQTGERGFRTTVKSKAMIINNLNEMLHNDREIVRDGMLLKELFSFISTEGRKMGADTGCHDDHVIAKAIALMAVKIDMDQGMGRADIQPLYINSKTQKTALQLNRVSAALSGDEERENNSVRNYLSPVRNSSNRRRKK